MRSLAIPALVVILCFAQTHSPVAHAPGSPTRTLRASGTPPPADASDLPWPSWRGPTGTGITNETGLPSQWSDAQGVAWRVKLPGAGVSTPVVAAQHVFVTSQIGTGTRRPGTHPSLVQGADGASSGERTLSGGAGASSGSVRFVVTAYRWNDGGRVWQHETPADGPLTGVHDKHNLSTPSPITDGSSVIAWFGTGQVVALDAANGKQLWTRHLAKQYGPFEINWGHASSPVLHGDLAIFPCYHEPASYLVALDKKTGAVRWKRDRQPTAHSYSTPLVVTHDGQSTLVLNSSRGVEAFDPTTGEPLWHVLEDNRFPIPMPVHHQGILYLSRGYRSSPYLALRLGGKGDVTDSHVVWKTPTGAPYVSSLVYYDGLIYMASELGIVTAIDPANGQSVWRERIGGVFTASPVAGDGKIYLASETGETVVLRAGRKHEVLARNKVNTHLVASPAIARGRLFLRGDDELVAVGHGNTEARR
jgi:outer membrane protein assembly factor BamB